MRWTRRVVPVVVGVAVTVGGIAVAAVALPGRDLPRPVIEDPVGGEVATTAGALPAQKVQAEDDDAPATPKLDTLGIAAAYDSFPKLPQEQLDAQAAKQAERVAAKKAEEDAQREAAEQAAKEADEKEAVEAKAADKDAGDKGDTKQGTDTQEKSHAKDGSADWWPGHVAAHLQHCTSVDLAAGTVTGTWDVWLKGGGDWSFVAATPAPASEEWHGDDKLRLTLEDQTATVVKEKDGWSKAKGGPVTVTVAKADASDVTKTFTLALWVKIDPDGTCHP